MRPVQLLFILVATLILALPTSAQQSCVLSGYIYRNDLSPAAEHILRVNATVPLDTITSLFSASASSDTSDATGYIELTVRRNSVIYISCDPRRPVKGIPTTPPGIALTVPDAPTHQLAALLPATQVPAQHIVAIPAQTSAYGDSLRVADSLARLANERVLSPPHGDSLRTADSLARVALDSASAARQDLLVQVAQLQDRLDTAGAATRAVIEADIAALYGQVSTLSGQIADLSAQVDTVGAAARAALEADVAALDAENAAQDLLIADAGKWEGTTEITPKAGITSVRTHSITIKPDSGTVYKPITFLQNISLPNWTKLYWGNLQNSYYIKNDGIASGIGYGISAYGDITLSSSAGRLLFSSRSLFGSPTVNYYSANFGGNVWVNPDSVLYAGYLNLIHDGSYTPSDTSFFVIRNPGGVRMLWADKPAANVIALNAGYFKASTRIDAPYFGSSNGLIWAMPYTNGGASITNGAGSLLFTARPDSLTLYKQTTFLSRVGVNKEGGASPDTLFSVDFTKGTGLRVVGQDLTLRSSGNYGGAIITRQNNGYYTFGMGTPSLAGATCGVITYGSGSWANMQMLGLGQGLIHSPKGLQLYNGLAGGALFGIDRQTNIALPFPSSVYFPTNFAVHEDSTAFLPTIRTSLVHWDTLGVQQGDTLQYYVKAVKHPITFVYNGSTYYPATKQGSVTFIIPADMTLGPIVGMFRADSVANVHIQMIRQKGEGGRATVGSGTWENYCSGFEEWVNVSSSATVNWGSVTGAKAPRLRGTANNPGAYCRQFSVMGVGGNASDAYGLIEVEVIFIMDSDSQSSWYVTIDDL